MEMGGLPRDFADVLLCCFGDIAPAVHDDVHKLWICHNVHAGWRHLSSRDARQARSAIEVNSHVPKPSLSASLSTILSTLRAGIERSLEIKLMSSNSGFVPIMFPALSRAILNLTSNSFPAI